ncbi:type II toxin-antitoxin system RelE/ParE family toxin [Candidatus Albibeggiatoa sp. nov. BB20]|uniref:type II toxin-antitoxin system RelE/ParE family toxin n=1 Tax=Candidatus Albibeggiatoa sp. nov. BB20 TaxID=3162723 RepID=UPI0033655A27
MSLKFTSIAHDDLDTIWEYIAENNPPAATRVLQVLMNKCHTLGENPFLGRQRDELATGLRSFPVQNHVIFYRITSDNVEIIRVLNTARDIDKLF